MKEIKTMCWCSQFYVASQKILSSAPDDEIIKVFISVQKLVIMRNRDATIGTAILFKFRLSRMNLIQNIISLILHAVPNLRM